MPKQIGLFVDVARQFRSVSLSNRNARVNYERYLQAAIEENDLHRAFAYIIQIENEAATFITALKQIGYEPKYKQARLISGQPSIRDTNWNVGISMDVVRNIKLINTVIIGSNDPELAPLIEWIKEQGVKVEIFSFSIPKSLRMIADRCTEITNDILDIKEDKDVDQNRQNTPES